MRRRPADLLHAIAMLPRAIRTMGGGVVMPVLRQGIDGRGRPRYVRAPYDPKAYTVPPGWIERVRSDWAGYSPDEILDDPGGPFGGLAKLRVVERGGKRFQLVVAGGSNEFAIEVEVGCRTLGEIRALAPEEAYAIARAFDATRDPPVEEGPVDPMMPPTARLPDPAYAGMVRAWAATLSETSDPDVATIVIWLGFAGTIHFDSTTATLEPAPEGTIRVTFDHRDRTFEALHVTLPPIIWRSDFEPLMKATAEGNPGMYRYQMPGGPFSTVVIATYEGGRLTKVSMRRDVPVPLASAR